MSTGPKYWEMIADQLAREGLAWRVLQPHAPTRPGDDSGPVHTVEDRDAWRILRRRNAARRMPRARINRELIRDSPTKRPPRTQPRRAVAPGLVSSRRPPAGFVREHLARYQPGEIGTLEAHGTEIGCAQIEEKAWRLAVHEINRRHPRRARNPAHARVGSASEPVGKNGSLPRRLL